VSDAGRITGTAQGRAQLRASVAAAVQALGALREGLLASGFQEALPTYQRMVEVLHAQAQVARLEGMALREELQELSGTATDVLTTLQPWTVMMRALVALPVLDPIGPALGDPQAKTAVAADPEVAEGAGPQSADRRPADRVPTVAVPTVAVPTEPAPAAGIKPSVLDEVLLTWLAGRPTGASISEAAQALGVTQGSCARSMARLGNRGRVRRGRAGGRVVWTAEP
jgi:hypothetical protein